MKIWEFPKMKEPQCVFVKLDWSLTAGCVCELAEEVCQPWVCLSLKVIPGFLSKTITSLNYDTKWMSEWHMTNWFHKWDNKIILTKVSLKGLWLCIFINWTVSVICMTTQSTTSSIESSKQMFISTNVFIQYMCVCMCKYLIFRIIGLGLCISRYSIVFND